MRGREGKDRKAKKKTHKNRLIKHLLDSPICAKLSERDPSVRGRRREIERWWAKKKGRRRRWRHGAHVNNCQELFWGENVS